MRIGVMHEALYRYDTPAAGVTQMLRLTPRNHAGQYVVDWRIDISADCRLEPQEDAFGNIVHAVSAAGPLSGLRLLAEGEVETQDTSGVVKGAVERFPPGLFLRETPLTRADAAIAAYAAELRPAKAGPGAADGTLSALHGLLRLIHEDIDWDTGPPSPSSTSSPSTPGSPGTTAATAFAARRGGCGDMAHIFIAAARSLGVPARYVSGYLCGDGDGGSHSASGNGSCQSSSGAGGFADAGAGDQYASQTLSGDALSGNALAGHAWAEAHVPGLGWVGFDPALKLCVTDRHIRVAMGLDHLGAAPLRSAQFGGGGAQETLAVRLTVVSQAGWQAQG
jgi:transglutaminase-like putative cysteine protease